MSKAGFIKLNIPANIAQLTVTCVKKSLMSAEDNELPLFIFINQLEKALARKRRSPNEINIEVARTVALTVLREFHCYFHPDADELRSKNSISNETENAFRFLVQKIEFGLEGRRSRRHFGIQIDNALKTALPSQYSKLMKRKRHEEALYNQPLNPLPIPPKAKFS